MKTNIPNTKSEQAKGKAPEGPPVMQPEPVLTVKAEAKAANKLPRDEQLNRFEKELEVHDGGNQPA